MFVRSLGFCGELEKKHLCVKLSNFRRFLFFAFFLNSRLNYNFTTLLFFLFFILYGFSILTSNLFDPGLFCRKSENNDSIKIKLYFIFLGSFHPKALK